MKIVKTTDVIEAIDRHTFDTENGLCLDEDITCILEEIESIDYKKIYKQGWEDAQNKIREQYRSELSWDSDCGFI